MTAPRRAALKFLAVASGVASYLAMGAFSVPGASLWAGAIAGFFCAARVDPPVRVSAGGKRVALAVIGCSAGAMIDREVLSILARYPVEAVGGVAATIVVTMVVGQLLLLSPHVDPITAALASIAGGASGVSAVAGELGADERIVLAVQYLRVVFVLGSIPLAIALFSNGDASSTEGSGPPGSWWVSGAVVLLAMVADRWVRFPASGLLLPMLLAGALSLGEVAPSVMPPVAAQECAFAFIGLMVGVAFDQETVRVLRAIAPLAIFQAVIGMLGCLGVAWVLATVSELSMLDAYLATTPGGLPAVIAAAVSTGGSIGVITAMQVARVVISLFMAPVIGRLFPRSRPA